METNKLTLIACAGSILAGTLFLAAPSQAMPLQNIGDTQGLTQATTPQITKTEDLATPVSYEQRLEQASFSRFGCTCANCMNATRQLVQSGSISL